MELYFNVTGEHRKELVKDIGIITHTVPRYKGTFKRLYAIGDMTVDKDGVLSYDETVVDEATVKTLVAALAERGFLCTEESTLTIEMPLTGFTEVALANLERLVASKA